MGTGLDAGNISMNKADVSACMELAFRWEIQANSVKKITELIK